MFIVRPASAKAETARRLMPAWMVMKSTPSRAWASMTCKKSSEVMSFRSFCKNPMASYMGTVPIMAPLRSTSFCLNSLVLP